MAVTLTEPAVAEGTVHVSFPILKWERDGDGDLVVRGVATDGTVDHDDQIVDPQWSAKALDTWIGSGGNVRMAHNAQRPVGKGLKVEVNKDGTDKHWVTSVIVDRDAQRLVEKGVLTAYSVGISRPVIRHDPTGKARGGIIVGGELAELSIVDRPSNKSSYLELAKAAADGSCEFTGKMFGGDDEAVRKALDEPDLTKGSGMTDTWAAPDPSTVDVPKIDMAQDDLSVSFTPDDMMRLMQAKFVTRHYDDLAVKAVIDAEAGVYKRDIDTATRRRLAADGKALPNLSYPIENAGDLSNAAHLARTGHGDVAAARRLIARRARELGVANPLDESDDVKKSSSEGEVPSTPEEQLLQDIFAQKADAPEAAVKEAEPEVTKDPEPEDKPKPVKKAKGKKKKLPPWLNKPADGDDDGDSDDDDKADKAAHCGLEHEHTEKCHTPPAEAAGVSASPMNPAPVKELLESDGPVSTKGATPASASGAVAEHMTPVPRHREPDGAPMEALEADAGMSDGDSEKPARLEAAAGMKAATAVADLAPDPEVAALLRFKMAGADEDAGRIHDLTCPAYHPDTVAKYHPYADLGSLIDAGAWQKKTLAAAAGPMEAALKAQEVWQAALLLKTADPADLNQWRLELHKAFRDANPGPGSFPTPGRVSPQPYNRPVLTDGRAANGVDYAGPNSSPQVASGPPNAENFDRPPLSSAHQSPSPSHMKGGFEYPSERGVPVQLSYAAMQKEQQRQALVRMHHHLSRQFPEVCPIGMDPAPQPENHPVPAPAGIGKAIDPEPAPAAPVAAAFKAEPENGADLFADADVYKSFKKMRKRLGKKVLSGKMTVDEARAKMGRQFAQKGSEVSPAQIAETQAALQKAAAAHPGSITVLPPGSKALEAGKPPVAAAFDPEVIKAAVADATSELKDLLVKQQEDFTTKLAEQQKVIDAIADQPDPSTAAFTGLAFQPQTIKSRRPAAVPDQAEYAARAQEMVRRNLQNTYQTHSHPAVREAAGEALAKLGVPEVAS